MGRQVCALVFLFVASGALTACAGGESFADENAALRVQLETLTSELDEATELDGELIELRAQVEALTSELDETAAADEVADALGLADKVVELRSQVEALTSQLDEAEVEMGEVSSENSELQSRVEDLEVSLAVAEAATTTATSTTTTTTTTLPPTTTTTTSTTTTPPRTTAAIDWGKATRQKDWDRTEYIDEMDGSKTVVVEIEGEPVRDWLGDSVPVSLRLACYEAEQIQAVNLSIYPEDFAKDFNGDTKVRLKFDDDETVTLTKSSFSYSTSFSLKDFGGLANIVDQILDSKILKAELTPWESYAQVSTIQLEGLAPFVPELRELCNW